MTYQEFRHDPAANHRYWARSFVGWRVMDSAVPNRTHYALVELERAGLVNGVVTQNVDGLHKQAGSAKLVALHGDMETVVCLMCGYREVRTHFDARLAAANPGYLEHLVVEADQVNPDGDVTLDESDVAAFRMAGCERCGSELLKPDVVYFGEPVPAERRDAAFAGPGPLAAGGWVLSCGDERVSLCAGGKEAGQARSRHQWRARPG